MTGRNFRIDKYERQRVTVSGKLDAESQCGQQVFEIPVESEKDRKKFINEMNDEINLHNDVWPDINLQTTDETLDRYIKEGVSSEQDLVCLYYVNENNVETCTKIQFLIGNMSVFINIGRVI